MAGCGFDCWIEKIFGHPPRNPIPPDMRRLQREIQSVPEAELDQKKPEFALDLLEGLVNAHLYDLVAELGPHLEEVIPATGPYATLLAQGKALHTLALGKLGKSSEAKQGLMADPQLAVANT